MTDTTASTRPARRIVPGLLFALLLLAALAIIFRQYLPLPALQADTRLDALAQKTDALERQVNALSQRVDSLSASRPAATAASPAEAQTLQALQQKLDALSGQQNNLSQSVALSGGMKQTLDTLSQRVDSLENNQQSIEAHTRNLITQLGAFYRLNDAVRAGRPYATELAQMEEFAADQAAMRTQLAKLTPYAQTGMPAFWKLRQLFSAAARDALAPKAGARANTWDKLLANIESQVTIRRVGAAPDASGPRAAIARAEAHMDRHELQAAIGEVIELPEPYKSAFTDWIDTAQFTQDAPRALLFVQNQILSDIYVAANLPPSAADKPQAPQPPAAAPVAAPAPSVTPAPSTPNSPVKKP
jgi:hypothetical protein